MKKISLSEIEVNDLLDLYQSEIDRAQRRINNLKTIVKKISEGKSIEPSEEKPVKAQSKRGRKPKVKVAETKIEKIITTEPKKRGRKPKVKVEAKVEVKKEQKVKVAKVKAEPKKRGPKPKAKIEVKKEQKVKVVKVKAEPKKRGPKAKVKKVEQKAKPEVKVKAKVESKKVDKKIVAKVEPKKRGRKPKVGVDKVVVADENKGVKVADKAQKVKPKVKATKKKAAKVKAEPKKRGRKPKSLRKPIKGGKGKEKVKWNVFINETITSKDSLMLASSLTQAALEKFEIPASDRDRVRMAISTTLTKMANKDKELHTYTQAGIRGAFFGLAKWFNDKGELNNDYKKKLM